MEYVNFPFIMGYFRSFRDDDNVYFLLEFIRGLELFDVIRDIGSCMLPQCRPAQ